MRTIRFDSAFIRLSSRVAACVALLLGSPLAVAAAPVIYTEVIEDLDPAIFPALDATQNLRRTTTLGSGAVFVESDLADITAQNSLNSEFGVWTAEPIQYRHLFFGVPPVETFLSASLTINAVGVNGGLLGGANDPVVVDFLTVGFLQPGGVFVPTQTETVFSTNLSWLIGLALADGGVNITITPRGIGTAPDSFIIKSSLAQVTYEPVPEPATFLLLGAGGAALLRSRRRRGAVNSAV